MNYSPFVTLPECFRILNVTPGVDWDTVKRSYYSLARDCHPDRHPGDVSREERFKALARAFRTLRQYYQEGGGHPTPSSGRFSTGSRVEVEAEFFDEGLSPQGPSLAGTTARHRADVPGPGTWKQRFKRWSQRVFYTLCWLERRWLYLDVETRVTLAPEVVRQGGAIKVRRGWESFQVRVPPGTSPGTVLRVPGKGDSGIFHRARGDLLIRIEARPSSPAVPPVQETFYQVRLDRQQVLQRGLFVLETPQGPIHYSLPATTRHGQTFTLRGHPDPATGRRTRHVVTVLLD